jgi:hypothetical protein
MFGFNMGRLGPTDHTLSFLETADRRGTIQCTPDGVMVGLRPGYVDHLRSLPRAELVTFSDVRAIATQDVAPAPQVSDLLLPASEFLVEMEPPKGDFAKTRMVHVQHLADTTGDKLVVTVISRTIYGAKWSITVPASMTWLGECQLESMGSNAIPQDGMEVFRKEMGFAAFGIAVVDARQREMLGIAP